MASHSTPRVSIYIPTGLNHRTKVCARHFNQDHLAHTPTSGRRMTTPKRTRSTTLVNGKDSIESWHYKTSTTSTRRPSSTESTPARITARDLVASSPPHFGYPIAPNTIGEFHKFFRDLIVLLAGHHNRLVFSPFKVS